jgi:hypothetical protein
LVAIGFWASLLRVFAQPLLIFLGQVTAGSGLGSLRCLHFLARADLSSFGSRHSSRWVLPLVFCGCRCSGPRSSFLFSLEIFGRRGSVRPLSRLSFVIAQHSVLVVLPPWAFILRRQSGFHWVSVTVGGSQVKLLILWGFVSVEAGLVSEPSVLRLEFSLLLAMFL